MSRAYEEKRIGRAAGPECSPGDVIRVDVASRPAGLSRGPTGAGVYATRGAPCKHGHATAEKRPKNN